jgi:hypothetical protein
MCCALSAVCCPLPESLSAGPTPFTIGFLKHRERESCVLPCALPCGRSSRTSAQPPPDARSPAANHGDNRFAAGSAAIRHQRASHRLVPAQQYAFVSFQKKSRHGCAVISGRPFSLMKRSAARRGRRKRVMICCRPLFPSPHHRRLQRDGAGKAKTQEDACVTSHIRRGEGVFCCRRTLRSAARRMPQARLEVDCSHTAMQRPRGWKTPFSGEQPRRATSGFGLPALAIWQDGTCRLGPFVLFSLLCVFNLFLLGSAISPEE